GDEYAVSVSVTNTGDVTFSSIEWDYFMNEHQMSQPAIQLTNIAPGDTRSLRGFTSTVGEAAAGQTIIFKVVVTAEVSGGSSTEFTGTHEIIVYMGAPAKRSIKDCTITTSWSSKDYSGDSQIPTLTITDGDYTLQEGTDYTVQILKDGDPNKPVAEAVDVGNYGLVISGAGNYEDDEYKDFTIKRRRVIIRVYDKIADWTGSELSGNTDYIDDGNPPLVSGHTATVTYTASHGTDVGTYNNGSFDEDSFTVVDSDGNDVTANYRPQFATGKLIIEAAKISNCEITLSAETMTYNGASQVPTITVTYGGTALTANTDYTVEVSQRTGTASGSPLYEPVAGAVDVGEYRVTITGAGTYQGTEQRTFYIDRRPVTVSVADKTVDWTGEELSGETAYAFDNVVDGHTATITYTAAHGTAVGTYENGEFDSDFQVLDSNDNDVTSNYLLTGTTPGSLTIEAATPPTEEVSVQVTIAPSPAAVRTVCTATVVVTNNGDETIAALTLYSSFDGQSMDNQSTTNLEPGQSFSCEFYVRINRLPDSGELEFIARAVDEDTNKEYTGTGTVRVVLPIDDCTIVFEDQVYTGSEITPVPTITWGDRTLEEGTDFTAGFYMDNVDVGSAIAYVQGMGDFGGFAQRSFTIKRREITVSVADKTVDWTGEELSGETTYAFDNVVDGHTATITYTAAHGTAVGTYDNGVFDSDFRVVDWNGGDVTANYELTSTTAGKLIIEAATPPTPTGPEITQQPADKTVVKGTLTYFRTVAQGAGTIHYQWMYRTSESSEPILMSDGDDWYDTGTALLKIIGRLAFNEYQFACDVTDETGTVRTDWATLTVQESTPTPTEEVSVQVSTYPTIVNVGGVCDVTVVVTNNGDGTIAKLALRSSFDGQSMTEEGTTNLEPGQSFTCEFVVNVTRLPDSGELEFVARAVDDNNNQYTGTGTILAIPSIADCTIVFAEQVYTGSEITPVPTITWGERTLEEGTDFKVHTYSDNVNAGSASVYINGLGEFGDTILYSFTIAQRPVTVSVADKTATWTGEELYGNTEYVFANVVEGHTATITYTPASGQDAATYNNGAFGNDFQVLDGNGIDVTRNYELVSAIPGKLTINAPAMATLTIEYVYANGGEAAPSYVMDYTVGTGYDVVSPRIEHYTADTERVTGTMGEDGAQVTVTYTGEPATITLDLGEGTLDGQTGTIEIPAHYGDTIKLPAGTPTLEGYTFVCWRGSEYQPGADYTVTGDHTLTAEFKKNSPTVPDTGDATPLALAIGLALLSATAAAVALAFARRRG
ncbi:MAG: MucBP domain-containing protein, partial [Eggerthellaceae bacterium]|nr:MucBP domain-containing protein [Eggerthellaceae bacterium]